MANSRTYYFPAAVPLLALDRVLVVDLSYPSSYCPSFILNRISFIFISLSLPTFILIIKSPLFVPLSSPLSRSFSSRTYLLHIFVITAPAAVSPDYKYYRDLSLVAASNCPLEVLSCLNRGHLPIVHPSRLQLTSACCTPAFPQLRLHSRQFGLVSSSSF